MARNESDREDMIREATALRNRVEWKVPGESELVFAGVKAAGWLAIYFGPDPVYQFNEEGSLRRAFVDGFLYRSHGTTLARLKRTRRDDQTNLTRLDLTPEEVREFLERMDQRLSRLVDQLSSGTVEVVRQIETDTPANFEELVRNAMRASVRLAPAIAHRPA
jgi:recombinational DNA repair ATPase RecF